MSASQTPSKLPPPLDLSKWRKVPNMMIGVGAVLVVLGAAISIQQFAYAWLQAFMFCLSLCLGALFLVLAHHLFDAGWSVRSMTWCQTMVLPEASGSLDGRWDAPTNGWRNGLSTSYVWPLVHDELKGPALWRRLPLAPIWPGFAINTLFYAALLWLGFCGPFALRRQIRRKHGRCVKCGYDLRGAPGTDAGCPECGWNREAEE